MHAVAKLSLLAAIAAAPLLAPEPSEGQIFRSKKDVEAQMRVDWLTRKNGQPHHPSERVQRYAQCMAAAIIEVVPDEFQDLDWEVIVFDNPGKNASVTIHGKISILSGLFDAADTPDKFAAVLGHEVAHLTEGHVMERNRQQRLTSLAGVAGGAATGLRNEAQAAATVGLQYPYQRKQESEADLSGIDYMARAGYDPRAAVEIWQSMGADGRLRQSEFLSTHPEPQLRMEELARNLAPALVTYNRALDAGVRPRCDP